MTRTASITTVVAHSRVGRATLHLLCLVRGRHVRWHFAGIRRELFGSRRRGLRPSARSHPAPGGKCCGLVLFVLLAAHLSTGAENASLPLELLPAAQVDGHGIYLHQIVSKSQSDLPPIRLADAPALGQTVSLSPAQLTVLLQKAAPELATNGWTGAPQIRITRRTRLLNENELRDLLTATLQRDTVKDRGELDLRFSRPWTPVNVPDEPFELKILDLPASGVTPNFIVRFGLRSQEAGVRKQESGSRSQESGVRKQGAALTPDSCPPDPWLLPPVQMVVQCRLMKDVLVARSNLKRGQPLAEADVITERRDVMSLREPLDPATLGEPGIELNETVSAGQPLLARSVRLRPIILRGQLVDAVMLEGTLHITLKVEVLTDALPGQTVRVRNPKTKREFYAKVQNDQTVLFSL